MDKNEVKYYLVDNIVDYLKIQLLDNINESNEKFQIFNVVLILMSVMNKEQYTYTLKDLDDTLFDQLITEILHSFSE